MLKKKREKSLCTLLKKKKKRSLKNAQILPCISHTISHKNLTEIFFSKNLLEAKVQGQNQRTLLFLAQLMPEAPAQNSLVNWV